MQLRATAALLRDLLNHHLKRGEKKLIAMKSAGSELDLGLLLARFFFFCSPPPPISFSLPRPCWGGLSPPLQGIKGRIWITGMSQVGIMLQSCSRKSASGLFVRDPQKAPLTHLSNDGWWRLSWVWIRMRQYCLTGSPFNLCLDTVSDKRSGSTTTSGKVVLVNVTKNPSLMADGDAELLLSEDTVKNTSTNVLILQPHLIFEPHSKCCNTNAF